MGARNNIFKNYPNKIFIETGSYFGDGIQMAIDAGFSQIYSIELSDKYFKICKNRFSGIKHVHILHGESQEVLPGLLETIKDPVTFWLDGHYSGGDTALGKYWSPLMQELDAIKNHFIKSHTIIIDDLRCWRLPNEKHGFTIHDIIKKLNEINPEYYIEYLDGYVEKDILAASIKNNKL